MAARLEKQIGRHISGVARLYAAAQSVIATATLNGKSALQAIRDIIMPQPALDSS